MVDTRQQFVYQHRGWTKAEWIAKNPTLAAREIGIEVDTDLFKIGDGLTDWVSLPYANGTGIHYGPTPPEDTGKLWVDTDPEPVVDDPDLPSNSAPIFVQSTPPVTDEAAYTWWDTSGGGLTLWIEDGT